ncbi:hypothetical protein [Pyxidicoccus xibeiensis]|uniref:hypothetical protein n=1 Tax=Pyxidicoccus xibeiensis TaxID=2906759 RepID=UPI0020A7F8D8|nr:hypothetical protein [Pyxidicoccus xibeiensis]MCP3138805.1 hypothetical protein [Pyxidicoccus xibeiensis]
MANGIRESPARPLVRQLSSLLGVFPGNAFLDLVVRGPVCRELGSQFFTDGCPDVRERGGVALRRE